MNTKLFGLKRLFMAAVVMAAAVPVQALRDSLALKEVVVTGTRNATEVRHLPMTVSVISQEQLSAQQQPNVLPTVAQLVPSLFVTSRGMMGYGVSGGAAGGINMRGISGGAGQLMVLIDGHPQYQGIYGHPISDSYQTLMADHIEVLRGPASVLYGSNAMGGVMNIVTRKPAAGNDVRPTSTSVPAVTERCRHRPPTRCIAAVSAPRWPASMAALTTTGPAWALSSMAVS